MREVILIKDYTKERIKSYLKDLTQCMGVSGSEQEVTQYLFKKLEKVADEVKVDREGNVIAIKKGSINGPNLMISAHSDEVGLCVKNILNNGYIVFDRIGGVPDYVLQGRKVWISSKKIPGII